MDNLTFGILTILVCTILFFFSWKRHLKNDYKIALWLLLIGGFVLRLYAASDLFLHEWDERYHALVAKNLMSHPMVPTLYDQPVMEYDYKIWMGNHIWVHKQPLPLWTMASSMSIFGINEIALRLPSILLTTIGIGLTFSIGAYFFNRKTGYIAAFLYTINGLILELVSGRVATDHIDIFFLFFVELAVFLSICYVRRQKTLYNVLVGISIGAAILCKWLPALIVLPIWGLLLLDSKQFSIKQIVIQSLIVLVSCVAVFLPWQLYIHSTFPVEAAWEADSHFRHITEVLGKQTGPFYYFFNQIRINYGELIYLPFLWFLWRMIKNRKDYKRLALVVWFLVPTLFFSFVTTKMQAYILFTAPALFLMIGEFYVMLDEHKQHQKYRWVYNLILVLLIALPVRYMIERVKPFDKRERHPEWVVQLKQLDKESIEKGVLFNYNRPIEAMFYTDLTVYSILPPKYRIERLVNEGYTILIHDDGKIPT